jgi:hypothetical protein
LNEVFAQKIDYDKIIIFSPTCKFDQQYKQFFINQAEKLKKKEHLKIYEDIDMDVVSQIVEKNKSIQMSNMMAAT